MIGKFGVFEYHCFSFQLHSTHLSRNASFEFVSNRIRTRPVKSCAFFGDLEGCRVYRGFIEKLPTKRIQFGPCFAICSNGAENIYENELFTVETEVEDHEFHFTKKFDCTTNNNTRKKLQH